MMTPRERFRTVLEGGIPDRVPIVSRLDIWYTACANRGTLPAEAAGLSLDAIERKLGMGRSARFRSFHTETRDGVSEEVRQEGERTIRLFRIRGGEIRQVFERRADQIRDGLEGTIVGRFLKTAADYRTMIQVWERTSWRANHEAARRFEDDTGESGFPLLVFTPLPADRIMIEYAGYENFYFHLADFPDLVLELLRVMEARYREFWPELARAPMKLILHGAHWSSQMTPRRLFERLTLPYAREFTAAMHHAGKLCALHADADLCGLLDLVLETGMDVAECFACHPLTPLRLEEARERWKGKITIWGGFPSTLLEPLASDSEFQSYLSWFETNIADGRGIIVGVSDNVMPDALWPRLVELAQRVSAIRPRS